MKSRDVHVRLRQKLEGREINYTIQREDGRTCVPCVNTYKL